MLLELRIVGNIAEGSACEIEGSGKIVFADQLSDFRERFVAGPTRA